jgi:Ca2+-binding RTX toxin-like protein
MVDVKHVRGELTITGSNLNDSVYIRLVGSSLAVTYSATASWSSYTSLPTYSYQTKTFAAGTVTNLVADLKGGNDTLHQEMGLSDAVVHGGPGNDKIRGRFGSFDTIARLNGDGGNDTFEVEGQFAYADGGAGSDTFRRYGTGFGPMVDYSTRTANIVADINSVGGDGEAGENDSIEKSCFGIIGGSGNDYLAGSFTAAGTFTNGEGAFKGNAGNDTIWGGIGYDVIEGGIGNDQLHSGSPGGAPDIGGALYGGVGNDTLWGSGNPSEMLNGEAGDDVIHATE